MSALKDRLGTQNLEINLLSSLHFPTLSLQGGQQNVMFKYQSKHTLKSQF